MEIEPPDTLLGLYQGTPLTERRWDYGNALPDRILIFQGPHEREAEDEDDLVVAIGETLIHEIGHYFGLSEEEIEEIEEQYWRGERDEAERDPARAQTIRPALPRAGLGRQGGRAPSTRSRTTRSSRSARAAARSRGRWPRARGASSPFEIDRDLARRASRRQRSPNVTVVEGDFLDVPADRATLGRRARASAAARRRQPALQRRVADPVQAGRAVSTRACRCPTRRVMLQREVADRLLARPGTGEYGVLSVLIGHSARRRAAADAAAGRLPAAAEGAVRGGPAALSRRPTRRVRDEHASSQGSSRRSSPGAARPWRTRCSRSRRRSPATPSPTALDRCRHRRRRRPETLSHRRIRPARRRRLPMPRS